MASRGAVAGRSARRRGPFVAPQVRARAPGTRVFVSFQADEANGEPLRDATPLPLIFVEGGWSPASTPLTDGTPAEQAARVGRTAGLLEAVHARLFISLTFTDLDIPALGLPPARAEGLSNFAHMGILDTELRRKPAYAAWLETFERPLAP